jgi:hypothetical protein
MTQPLLNLETMAELLEQDARERQRLSRLSSSLDKVIADIRELRRNKLERKLNPVDCREAWKHKISEFEKTAHSLTMLRTRRLARKNRAERGAQYATATGSFFS